MGRNAQWMPWIPCVHSEVAPGDAALKCVAGKWLTLREEPLDHTLQPRQLMAAGWCLDCKG